MKEDVQSFVKAVLTRPLEVAPAVPPSEGGLAVAEMPAVDFSQFGETEVRPLTKIKKLSGAGLHRNWVTIPHVTHQEEADITELEAFRKEMNEEAKKQGFRLTLIAFLLKASVAALKQFPDFNASLDRSRENLILKKYFNIGVAVDTPEGLVVPVIRDVDRKGTFELAKELAELSEKARARKLTPTDMSGGCFTISSLGGIGGTGFTPIVNAPGSGDPRGHPLAHAAGVPERRVCPPPDTAVVAVLRSPGDRRRRGGSLCGLPELRARRCQATGAVRPRYPPDH